jgi:hypothetical protein
VTLRRSAIILLVVAGCSDKAKPSAPVKADPWAKVGVGTVFESKSVTQMEKPFAHTTETKTRHTLLARTDKEVSFKLELTTAKGEVSTQDVTLPVKQEVPDHWTVTTKAADQCTVGTQTFDCTRTMMELRDGAVVRSTITWTAQNLPVPVKSVVTNENMTTTTELVAVTLN